MEDVKLKLGEAEYVLKPRTFKTEAEVEDNTITADEEGKLVYKQGPGHFKMTRVFKYLKSINGRTSITMKDDVEGMDPDHASCIIMVLDGTPSDIVEGQYKVMKEKGAEAREKVREALKELDKAQEEVEQLQETQ